MLGIEPKDFDIATDAHPEDVKKLFRNCILIGRRFRLAHVYFHGEIVEVATFRAAADENHAARKTSDSGMILRDNVYGTIEEDAWRRDFTLNALYYCIKDFTLVDYVGGFADIQNRVIRMIGDPVMRYHEDPVRMLRAVRIAAKLDFTIDAATEAPINKLVGLLQNVPAARLFEEINKWFRSGKSLATYNLLRQYGLFAVLFPQTEAVIVGENAAVAANMVKCGFANTDKRILAAKPLNPAFLFAVLLWWPLQLRIEYLHVEEEMSPYEALMHAMHEVLKQQSEHVLIPQKLRLTIKEIWVLQYRLEQLQKRKIYATLANPKFRAAYDFLLLRAEAGEKLQTLAAWWTKLQEVNEVERKNMIGKLVKN